MGSDGMRASLASRETIADSIELAVSGHCLDAVVMLVGCDNTIPAAAMPAARLDLPTVILYGGTIMPGQCRANVRPDRVLTLQDVFDSVGDHAAGRIGHADIPAIARHACPGHGARGGPVTPHPLASLITSSSPSPL